MIFMLAAKAVIFIYKRINEFFIILLFVDLTFILYYILCEQDKALLLLFYAEIIQSLILVSCFLLHCSIKLYTKFNNKVLERQTVVYFNYFKCMCH